MHYTVGGDMEVDLDYRGHESELFGFYSHLCESVHLDVREGVFRVKEEPSVCPLHLCFVSPAEARTQIQFNPKRD